MITVEDGSIVAGAESYCTVAFANDHHAKRGNTAWDALDDVDQKEPALRKATDYMLQIYRSRWKGARYSTAQALDWPRYDVYVDDVTSIDSDVVPIEVMRACAELALKASTETLYADQTQMKTRVKVGPIETEYSPHSPQAKRYPAIDALLAPLLARPANSLTDTAYRA